LERYGEKQAHKTVVVVVAAEESGGFWAYRILKGDKLYGSVVLRALIIFGAAG